MLQKRTNQVLESWKKRSGWQKVHVVWVFFWGIQFLVVWNRSGEMTLFKMFSLFLLGGLTIGPAWIISEFNSWKPKGVYRSRLMNRQEAEKFLLTLEEVASSHNILTVVHPETKQLMGIKPYTVASIQKELGHVTTIAPTRSGKGLAITANLLSWQQSCIVLDIKGENWRTTSQYRSTFSQVVVLNPEGNGSRFDFIAELMELGTDAEAALKQAVTLMVKPDEEKQKIFALKAIPALMAGMRVAYLLKEPVLPWVYATSRKGLRHYVMTVYRTARDLGDQLGMDYITEFLDRLPEEVTPDLWDDGRTLFAMAWSNVTTALGRICTDGVLKMASGRDFTATDLKTRPVSVYLIWREDMGQGARDVFEMVSMTLCKRMARYADDHKGQPLQDVMLIVDEAGTFKVPELPTLMATLAGRGIWMMPYFQGLKQIEDVFGPGADQTVIGNSSAVLWYPHTETAVKDYVQESVGKVSVSFFTESTSTSSGTSWSYGESPSMTTQSGKSRGQSEQVEHRPLITGDEFATLGENRLLLQTKNHHWLKAQPLRWFEWEVFKARGAEQGMNGEPIAFDFLQYRAQLVPVLMPAPEVHKLDI